MHVLATAGHVDHGKSTLVRALTGMEPDRWAEERRRGLTIDLGFAWTTLPSGAELAFVDVPGHQRFIANMLAGLGPAPAVLFVVAADEGWSRQSGEHLAAMTALDVRHAVLAVTRSDLADPGPAGAEARDRLAAGSIDDVEAVDVSGVTGVGLAELTAALDRLVGRLPVPDPAAPVRLWLDRAFTVSGSGTVVTGTLSAGTVSVGDEFDLRGQRVSVRAVQALGRPRDCVTATARIAVNLRRVDRADVGRGDVLLTPDAWRPTRAVDVRLNGADRLPERLILHVGTSAVPARLRPLSPGLARLALDRHLPLRAGDRGILRDPGQQSVAAGVLVLDADPPGLDRRGAASRRARALAHADGRPDPVAEIDRRGAVRRADLAALGVPLDDLGGAHTVGDWLVSAHTWQVWLAAVPVALDDWAARTPLEPDMPQAALRRTVGIPDAALLTAVVTAAGLQVADGRVRQPGTAASLGPAEEAVRVLEKQLRAAPFAAPERHELIALHLGRREIAAAAKAGRLIRIGDDIVLAPEAVELATRRLRGLPQPFTLSAARIALGTTRRVAVPLLEHLDSLGITEREDRARRRVVQADETGGRAGPP